ncbi:MAG TPA: trehalose-phosphatase [Acidimicrobiales bacterium]|nr:trehalose-phosphatase [Acidimicrobiales bacterium]
MPATAGSDLGAALGGWATGLASRAALCCDFDGTLAPIVDDPGAALPLEGTVEVLTSLARSLGLVAVVSGRPAAYLAERLPATGVVLAGLYGLERVVDGRVEQAPAALAWAPRVAEVADRAAAGAPAGLRVERKGATVALHWRTAPAAGGWAAAFAAEQAAATGLVAHPGKLSVELRPPAGGDKGDVVADLAGGRPAVAFLGDDIGDLPAFAALDRLAATGARVLKVAVGGDEAPAELLAAADLVVDGPRDVLAGLQWLAAG